MLIVIDIDPVLINYIYVCISVAGCVWCDLKTNSAICVNCKILRIQVNS